MSEQKRVILWAVPRSISTAFMRTMMNRPKVKVLMEPYSRAYYFGSERLSTRYQHEPLEQSATYQDIKEEYEQDYQDYDEVFVKDMAYYLNGRLTADWLPANYTHTFIIRDPRKTVTSLYKMSCDKDLTGWDHFDPSEVGYEELYATFRVVTEDLHQEAIVVDADDLLQSPERILSRYCELTNLRYMDSMLHWNNGTQDVSDVFCGTSAWIPWVEGVLNSQGFHKPTSARNRSNKITGAAAMTPEVKEIIEASIPFYQKMHEARIKI